MNHCRMPVIECYKILVKVLQYILSVHRSVKDVRENHTCPEIGVLFVTDKNGHKGSEVTVFYRGQYDQLLDVRCLIKVLRNDVNIINKLQLNVGNYTNFLFLMMWIFMVNFPMSLCKNLHNYLVSFLKKSQLMMPYLTVVSRINDLFYERSGIQGLPHERNWIHNITMYCRTYGSIGFHCAPVVQCKQVNLQQSTSQCSSFSIIYGASLGGDIEGVPLLVDNAEWHRAVSLPAALNDQLVLRPGPCAPELSDVCYCVDEGRPEVDYFLLFMIRDEQHLGLLLAQHSSQLASTLTEALHLTTSVVTSYERGKAWSHMIASSLGALIRFSQNNKLRNECFSLMKAADSMELEAKLEQELIHHLY
ncbi:Protein of unknown function [Gryllus bimaculatus]|nr:Protein of unknown function [Gryllus bimaculatus]